LEALQHFHESKETRLEVVQQEHTSIAKKVAEEAAAAAAKQAEKERLRLVAKMEKAQRAAEREAAKQRKLIGTRSAQALSATGGSAPLTGAPAPQAGLTPPQSQFQFPGGFPAGQFLAAGVTPSTGQFPAAAGVTPPPGQFPAGAGVNPPPGRFPAAAGVTPPPGHFPAAASGPPAPQGKQPGQHNRAAGEGSSGAPKKKSKRPRL
jgi:hypothetical protein